MEHLLKKKGAMTIDDIAVQLNLSRKYIHKVINVLLELNKIEKFGKAPVVYSLLEANVINDVTIDYQKEQFLNEHFIVVDPIGNLLSGKSTMEYWCSHQNLDFIKTGDEFIRQTD
jgi:hypothetical protein